jgi:hypothetical protein
MTNPLITVVTNSLGDWTGVYLNNELYYEGHDIPSFIWVELVGGTSITDHYGSLFGDFLDKFGGRYPKNLTEILELING